MPKLQKVYTLDITPQQFIDNCSDVELMELDLLLGKRQNLLTANDEVLKNIENRFPKLLTLLENEHNLILLGTDINDIEHAIISDLKSR